MEQGRINGNYIAIGAILGVGAGMLFNNLTAFAVIGVGLGFLAGFLRK